MKKIGILHKRTGVYCIHCYVTNRCYYGSSVNLERRKRKHVNLLRKRINGNPNLQKEFNKFGEKAFVFIVLEYINKGNLLSVEKSYVFNDKTCYNIEYNRKSDRIVYLFYKNGELKNSFSTVSDASYKLNISRRTIISSIHKRGLIKNIYRFSYKKTINKYIENRGNNQKPRITIGAYKNDKLIKILHGYKEASIFCNGRVKRIQGACAGKTYRGKGRIIYHNKYKGFEWKKL